MYDLLLTLHSWVRWVVVVAAVLAFGQALRGWLGRRDWTQMDDRLGLFFTISLDVQLLIGLILYVVSPLIEAAMQDFGAAMSASGMRFFAVEHVLMMVIAVVLAHVGRALSRRVEDAQVKHQRAAIFFGLSILLVLAAVPWAFREAAVSRPWFRL